MRSWASAHTHVGRARRAQVPAVAASTAAEPDENPTSFHELFAKWRPNKSAEQTEPEPEQKPTGSSNSGKEEATAGSRWLSNIRSSVPFRREVEEEETSVAEQMQEALGGCACLPSLSVKERFVGFLASFALCIVMYTMARRMQLQLLALALR